MKVSYVVIFLLFSTLFSSCLDNEESYPIDNIEYTIKGQYVKDCDGTPAAGVTLRLRALRSSFNSAQDVFDITQTDQFGNFELSYLDEKRYSGGSGFSLLIEEEQSNSMFLNRSDYLEPYKNLMVELIENYKSTIYLLASGNSNLTNDDTLFVSGSWSNPITLKSYYLGPFIRGKVLDSIVYTNTQGIRGFKWGIGDTNYRSRQYTGNYGEISINIPYCDSDSLFIDLSNTKK